MNYRLIFLWAFVLFPFSLSFAQYYDTGEDPAKLKWLQIKTPHFRVIYPEIYSKEGMKYVKSLDDSYTKLGSLFPTKKVRIPVIIHNYTTFSNGYVAWAPRRMELYPTPEQNTIPLDPVRQLTTHEMTHVMQMYSLKKGFSSIMPYLFGEQYTGALSVFLPAWFMEGDAVLGESLLTESGRGRTPSFQKQLKAISLQRGMMFSYDKMLHGSYRNFTPDDYQYGYQMVAWTYAKYDQQLWNKTLETTAKLPFTLVPVNYSLNKNAGLTKARLFREAFDSLNTLWKKDDSALKAKDYPPLNPSKKREYVNYYSPVVIGKDSIVAIKTSFYNPPVFVLIGPVRKTEKRILIPGEIYPRFLSGSKGKIVWVEKHPDPRWTNRDYSVIKIMDVRNKRVRQLTHRTRILAVSVSPDGKFIVASENTVENKNSILILDAFKGNIIISIPVPGNAFAQRPQWSTDKKEFTIISLSEEGEGIMSYSMETHQWKTLIKPGREDLQAALLRNDSLLFVSSSSGTDNIYIMAPSTNLTKLTNSRFGAYDLYASGNEIYFTDYSSTGNNICRINISEASAAGTESNDNSSFLINRFDTIKFKSAEPPATEYKEVPYRKWLHPFKFHSWMPFYADLEKIQADPSAVRPGFTLMSQNDLSTVISTIGYEYTGKKHYLHSKITLKGWYPVLESQLDYGGNPEIVKAQSSNSDPSVIYPSLHFTNTIYLPLSFSSGKFSQYLQTSVSSIYYNNYFYESTTGKYDYGQTQVNARIYFSNLQIPAMRDIYPKWAQIIDYNYSYYPFDKSLYGNRSVIKTVFYFPGFIKNHSIKFRFESEIQNPKKYILYNMASFPRSYKNIISQKLKFYSVDYTMPLFYPDLNIPGLLYLKRIRTSLFYDYAEGTKNSYFYPAGRVDHNYTESFKSFGGELMADFHLLRIPFMISGGVQAAWKNFNQSPAFEFLLRLDIYGMKIGTKRL